MYGALRRLPNWIFEGNACRPFHTLGELMTYIPAKFRENILIGGRDMPQYGPSGGGILLPVPFWQVPSFVELPVYDPTKCQENRTVTCICDSAFSIHTFKPVAQRDSVVMQAISRRMTLWLYAYVSSSFNVFEFDLYVCVFWLSCCIRWRLYVLHDLVAFAARRTALARHMLWRRGCLCVCHIDVLCPDDWVIIMLSLPDYSSAILVFPIPNRNPIAWGDSSHWGHQMGEGYVKVSKSGHSCVGRFVSDSWASCFNCTMMLSVAANTTIPPHHESNSKIRYILNWKN